MREVAVQSRTSESVITSPPLLKKSLTSFIVFVPFIAVASIPFLWPWIAVPSAMIVAIVLYFLTGQGITVSFHREHTHNSLELRPAASFVMYLFALFSVQGQGKEWVTEHKLHHQHTEKEGDPHSPHLSGGVIRGFIHAHCGWFFKRGWHDYERHVPKLLEKKNLMKLDELFPYIAVSSFVLPGILVLPFDQSMRGFLAGVFWGGFVRIGAVHHVTWCVNSVCHLWGTRPFKSNDQSANNLIFGILAFGEGWHRNHHAFQRSARIGLRWWEFDTGWLTIKVLDFFGQVRTMRLPTPEEMRTKRVG